MLFVVVVFAAGWSNPNNETLTYNIIFGFSECEIIHLSANDEHFA